SCLGLCLYDRRRFPPEVLLSILTLHPTAVIGTKVFDNLYYFPAQASGNAAGASAALEHMTYNLLEGVLTKKKLWASKNQLQGVLDNVNSAVSIKDEEGRYLLLNKEFERLFSVSSDKALGMTDMDLWPGEEAPGVLAANDDIALESKVPFRTEETFKTQDGSRTFLTVRAPLLDAQDRPYGLCWIATDITERARAEEAHRRAERNFRRIFDNAIEGIFVASRQGRFIEANPALARILGYASPEEMISKVRDIAGELFVDPSVWGCFLRQIEDLGSCNGLETQARRNDGQVIWISLNARKTDEDISGQACVEGTIQDLTARKLSEQRLNFYASHDTLTRLPNRSLFLTHLEKATERAKRRDYLFSVLFLDLDRFKAFNDNLGHLAGDKFLVEASRMLKENVRGLDSVARFGGDEFVVLLDDIDSPAETIRVAKRIREAFKTPFSVEGQGYVISVSIGIATSNIDYKHPEDLIRFASIAMRHAKEGGRDRFKAFKPKMLEHARHFLDIETDLRRALDNDEFVLEYQPIFRLDTGRVVGLEALVRWNHPVRGRVMPAEFIPVAEDTGLIIPLGRWILRQACRETAQALDVMPDGEEVLVAVNISGRQFSQPDLVEDIDSILKKSGLPARLLNLEITESVLMGTAEMNIKKLKRLKELGLGLSVDDFGTGYSSLNYLQRFSIDVLKIDRCFVSNMNTSHNDREIVRAIISLAHSLNMEVVAEGIEEHDQATVLRDLGCEYGQGFLVSRPVAMDMALKVAGGSRAQEIAGQGR
ncbi:MAG: EAL domain-containing protein, partial [Desulfovibrionaceae bacterium]|nr:EAL domain-containing protein [Desulfovibrionaceae bacterium]